MYIGRFAPSPTGELHFGSLLAALASYLDAKSHQGLWLLRIDDLDPPREIPGASSKIIAKLESFGLEWDGEIIYQSQRHHYYQHALDKLLTLGLIYRCNCSRKAIQARSGHSYYDGHCLNSKVTDKSCNYSWRFNTERKIICWTDDIQGQQSLHYPQLADFIVKRSDHLWAYQLAVAVDDQQMGITDIVRGNDLLAESAKQLALITALKYNPVKYKHIPLALNLLGQKLSKQNLAPALSSQKISSSLFQALCLLGQNPDKALLHAEKSDILKQAILNWNVKRIPLKYPDDSVSRYR
ncbi:MAG: hypothetical protein OFPI_22460 [Osedax symbiont Rs2]|nr:MAG: hypothetical protein OFPI_22460 [Osedax symbiont Rs2]